VVVTLAILLLLFLAVGFLSGSILFEAGAAGFAADGAGFAGAAEASGFLGAGAEDSAGAALSVVGAAG